MSSYGFNSGRLLLRLLVNFLDTERVLNELSLLFEVQREIPNGG
jgi:hypothetical protein